MNIQIYAGKKDFDTQKAMRYFKERNIRFQLVDLRKKPLSKGELTGMIRAIGLETLIDQKGEEAKRMNLAFHGISSLTEEILLQHPELLKTPIVRNGRQASVGFCPAEWATWQ